MNHMRKKLGRSSSRRCALAQWHATNRNDQLEAAAERAPWRARAPQTLGRNQFICFFTRRAAEIWRWIWIKKRSGVLDVYFHPEEPKRIHRRFRNFCICNHWSRAAVVYSDLQACPAEIPWGQPRCYAGGRAQPLGLTERLLHVAGPTTEGRVVAPDAPGPT
jgi:hypothetical protein